MWKCPGTWLAVELCWVFFSRESGKGVLFDFRNDSNESVLVSESNT